MSVLGSGCCPHIVLCPGRCGQGPGRTPVPVREGDEERAAGHTALLPPPAQLQPVGKGQGWRGQDTPGAPLGLRPPAPPQPRGGGRASWAVAELLCPTGHEQVLGSLRERPGLLRVGCVCGSVRDVPPCVSLGWTVPGPALCLESAGPGRSPGPGCRLCGPSGNSRAAASTLSVHPALRWASFLNPRDYMEAGAGPWTHGALPQPL